MKQLKSLHAACVQACFCICKMQISNTQRSIALFIMQVLKAELESNAEQAERYKTDRSNSNYISLFGICFDSSWDP